MSYQRWGGAIRVGGELSEVGGSDQRWRERSGGCKQSELEWSNQRRRGAIRGGGELSEVEGSDQRWRRVIRVGSSDQRRREAIIGGGERSEAEGASGGGCKL